MGPVLTPVLLTASFAATKAWGPERTAQVFERVGRLARWTPLRGRRLDPARIARRVERGYRFLPLPVECLDQAMVTWYLLNMKGHRAVLKIGMKLTPLSGHAWVEADGVVYGGIPGQEDMQVVGQFEAWDA